MSSKPSQSGQLLDRDEFRQAVFERDGHRCVMCHEGLEEGVNIDAHHIMERRLFTSSGELGGYYLDNGATLCDTGTINSCHLQAEQTVITCEEIREAAGIKRVILPEHLYRDQLYTKWGDPILPNGQRMRGELFHDKSVQTALTSGGQLRLYTNWVKHPRTHHLPFSPKVQIDDLGDDRVMTDLSALEGQRVIVTVKMDGSQSTLYSDYMHARTTDFKSDATWHWLQQFHSRFSWEIPEGWRVCCENLWAAHDIVYQHLPLYVMAHSMWDASNHCLAWDHFVEWCELLSIAIRESGIEAGLPHVPVLYDGVWDEKLISGLYKERGGLYNGDQMEGLVVRLADRFHYRDFRRCVGKWVRAEHRPCFGKSYVKNHLSSKCTY